MVLVIAVYPAAWEHGFLVLDDNLYVTENPRVRAGLAWSGAEWAFTTFHASNWHPLTWLSHMADVELFGLWAGGHHGMSVLLHAANTVLLFLLLRRMTGSTWRSGFAAALFAVHPLHVESVAWVAERKDILSGLFFFQSLREYARYAERPGTLRYLGVALWFVLGLMSKPMVVTLPFVLLLLDRWPLGRFRGDSARFLVLEKIPLFLLSAGSCIVTYLAQRTGGSVASLRAFPLASRLSNAAVSYFDYLLKTVWPSGLAVLYPHPASTGEPLHLWGFLVSGLFLAVATVAAVRWRDRGYPLTGWFWYVGMLVPVIGVVQAGAQAMADRYTYLPLTGVFVAASWGLGEFASGRKIRRVAVCAACLAALSVLSAVAWTQAGRWRDGVTLFDHALRVTRRNWMAHDSMGTALMAEGRYREAVSHYREAIRIRPGYYGAHGNLAGALYRLGDLEGAVSPLREALRINYADPALHYSLGNVYRELGRPDEAIQRYRAAIGLKPDLAQAHVNLGVILMESGETAQAERHFLAALQVLPGDPIVAGNLERVRRRIRESGAKGD